jgi:hypothetical protein
MLLACHGRQPAKNRATGDAKSRARALDSNVGDFGDYSGGKEPILPIARRQAAPGVRQTLNFTRPIAVLMRISAASGHHQWVGHDGVRACS